MNEENQKRRGYLIPIGAFLFPPLGILVLRSGYSRKAKAFSVLWMAVFVLVAFLPRPEKGLEGTTTLQTVSTEKPSRYLVPSDFSIDEDPNIHQILRNGLRYKVKSKEALLLSHGQVEKREPSRERAIGTLRFGDVVFFDNASSRFQKGEYIYVTVEKKNWDGWIHVKDLGYRKSTF